MNYTEYKQFVYSDLYRISENQGVLDFLKLLIFNEGFTYIFWLRTCKYLKSNKILKLFFYFFAKGMLRHYKHKFGIDIPFTAEIGKGFYIGHFGQIIVNQNCVIGNNCNISQGVTLGQTNRGKRAGSPTIGNNVYIGPGAKIIGGINIGDNVAIGANCVVTKDAPENAVVV